METKVVILAAGEGTRMKSSQPKVLHDCAGRSLVEWVAQAAGAVCSRPVVVIGSGSNAVRQALGEEAFDYAVQTQRLGSGHAVMAAEEQIAGSEYTVVLAGDMPLIRGESVKSLLGSAKVGGFSCMLLTGHMQNPRGYGRILRDEIGSVVGIVEEKDATDLQRSICEVNVSVYCFRTKDLLLALQKLRPANAQGEYYLTDCVKILHDMGKKVGGQPVEDLVECMGVNDRVQLAEAARHMRQRINEAHMRAGVTLLDPAQAYISPQTVIGQDTVIYPGVILEGECRIGSGCTLYQGSRLVDSAVGDGTTVENSVLQSASVGRESKIGPYAFLRPGAVVGDGCRVGDFVELKNAAVGNGTKISHLTYVGDAQLGEQINIGCGVVFVNYNGKQKFITKVGDRAFIGCNTNLISPVNIGEGAYIAAGATVTQDIPPDALCIARAKEVIKPGRAKGRYK